MNSVTHDKRTLTGDDKKFFMDLKPDDITLKFLHSTLTDVYDVKTGKVVKSKYNTFDEINLEQGEYLGCPKCTTNVGLFIFNKCVIDQTFGLKLGYINFTLNKKGYGKLQTMISNVIIADPNEESICRTFFAYMDRLTWLAFTFHMEICASMNMKIVKPLKKVTEEKKRLMKENKEAFDNVDITTVVKVQNQLVDLAKKEMENDPAYELYASGARGAFDNAYRQAQIMKGPVYDAGNGKWELISNSLYEGYEKKDIALLADSVVDGCYAKAISTGECGYLTKKIAAAFQTNVLDDPGTDCKTPLLTDVQLNDDNYGLYEYHYIKEGSKWVRLDMDSKSKYINKTIKMRLPGNCKGDKLCSRCAGDRYYMLNIQKIGLTNNRLANSLLRARMKAAHDATVRLWSVSLDNAVL